MSGGRCRAARLPSSPCCPIFQKLISARFGPCRHAVAPADSAPSRAAPRPQREAQQPRLQRGITNSTWPGPTEALSGRTKWQVRAQAPKRRASLRSGVRTSSASVRPGHPRRCRLLRCPCRRRRPNPHSHAFHTLAAQGGQPPPSRGSGVGAAPRHTARPMDSPSRGSAPQVRASGVSQLCGRYQLCYSLLRCYAASTTNDTHTPPICRCRPRIHSDARVSHHQCAGGGHRRHRRHCHARAAPLGAHRRGRAQH